jgi:predicted nucleotidyltransferase
VSTENDFPRILRALSDAGVRYVIIGGVAAAAHGSARITFDLDVCYEPTSDNRERLARALGELHAYLRGVEPGLPWAPDARSIQASPVLTLVTDGGAFDVMDRVAGVGEYPAVLAASREVTVFGLPTHVLSLGALISSKRAAGRKKDREVLLELEALQEIRRDRGLD